MSTIPQDPSAQLQPSTWPQGSAPVAVVMISLNEGHNIQAVLDNLKGWAQEVFMVDSYSADDTVDIALANGVHVVQRKFRGFGDQWNFALENLPITAPWSMKLDPDERLTTELKESIKEAIAEGRADGLSLDRRLWFMGKALPIRQNILRLWRTGRCSFTDVSVNEHPIVDGQVLNVPGVMEHHDSPNLHHWYHKQNQYSSAEAARMAAKTGFAQTPALFGTPLQRRMWLKKWFDRVPFRFFGVFVYYYLFRGLWRAGWTGYAWSRLRSHVYMMRHFKAAEMKRLGQNSYSQVASGIGPPDSRVAQFD